MQAETSQTLYLGSTGHVGIAGVTPVITVDANIEYQRMCKVVFPNPHYSPSQMVTTLPCFGRRNYSDETLCGGQLRRANRDCDTIDSKAIK